MLTPRPLVFNADILQPSAGVLSFTFLGPFSAANHLGLSSVKTFPPSLDLSLCTNMAQHAVRKGGVLRRVQLRRLNVPRVWPLSRLFCFCSLVVDGRRWPNRMEHRRRYLNPPLFLPLPYPSRTAEPVGKTLSRPIIMRPSENRSLAQSTFAHWLSDTCTRDVLCS